MDEKVTAFPGAQLPNFSEPNDAVIFALEDALAKAKSGQLQWLIMTGFTSEDERYFARAGYHDNYFAKLGAIESMKMEWIEAEKG
jgi:hypothetical protein